MGKWKSRPPLAAMPDATAAAIAQVEQNQRAFQKQDCIFVGKKRVLGKAKKGIRESRYFKSVGPGIKTPRATHAVCARPPPLHRPTRAVPDAAPPRFHRQREHPWQA